MNLALRCRCGEVGLTLDEPQRAVRGACYCRDCRAYTYFLGREGELLDEWGGTEIVVALQSRLRIERGHERIACASLSETGVLRWYASCCRSPIGNTPRNGGVGLGLIPTCLLGSRDEAAAAFGPLRMRVFRASARGEAPRMGASALLAGARYLSETVWARLSGSARTSPFFASDVTTPIVAPVVLSAEERARCATGAR